VACHPSSRAARSPRQSWSIAPRRNGASASSDRLKVRRRLRGLQLRALRPAACCDACACLPAMLRACMAWAWAAAAGLLSVRGQSRAHSSGESGDTQTTEADEDLLIFSAWAAAGPDLSGGDATGISARRETERFRGCHNPSRTGLTNLA
jgi:hypothetical protein